METENRFELKKWNAVALWSWNIEVDSCAICRNHIMEPCLNCQTNNSGDQECIIAWGVCNHAFHNHCIQKWCKSKNTCPLDQRDWEIQRFGQ